MFSIVDRIIFPFLEATLLQTSSLNIRIRISTEPCATLSKAFVFIMYPSIFREKKFERLVYTELRTLNKAQQWSGSRRCFWGEHPTDHWLVTRNDNKPKISNCHEFSASIKVGRCWRIVIVSSWQPASHIVISPKCFAKNPPGTIPTIHDASVSTNWNSFQLDVGIAS